MTADWMRPMAYLADHREAHGMSVLQLAVRTKIPVAAIYAFQSGHKMPMFPEVQRIAAALGVEVPALFSEPKEMKSGK